MAFTRMDLGWSAGTLYSLFEEAKIIAAKTDMEVSFDFNGVKVNMTKISTLEHVEPLVHDAIKHSKLSVFGEGWR